VRIQAAMASVSSKINRTRRTHAQLLLVHHIETNIKTNAGVEAHAWRGGALCTDCSRLAARQRPFWTMRICLQLQHAMTTLSITITDELCTTHEIAINIMQVAEAHARKRRRVLQRLAKARSKAETIVDNEDMSVVSKGREIGKLYAKAKAVGRGKGGAKNGDKKLSRSAREKAKRKGPPLDRRMIADKRRKGGGKEKGKGKGRR
jgi:hypothetical protein